MATTLDIVNVVLENSNWYVNNTKIGTAANVGANTKTIPIFGVYYNGGSIADRASIRVYSLKMYENGQIRREFVPCYRKSDNAIGLYDLVTNQFYTNAGTGTFVRGANVTY